MTRLLIAAGALAFVLGAAGNAAAQTVSILNAFANEGDGNLRVDMGLSGGGASEAVVLAVTYADGTGSVEDDLDSPPDTFTIPANTGFTTLLVPIVDDDESEGAETFTVTISITSAPAGVRLAGGLSTRSATMTIRAHEEAPPVIEATASIADAEAEEGAAIEFTVSLSAAVGSDVTLDVDVIAGESDTATLADDLGPRRGQVTILEGETRATFMVPTIADEDIEEDETFTVEISAREATPLPEGVTISDDGGTATGTILNDDEPPVIGPAATVSIDDVEVAEDVSGGNAEFTVTLSEMQGSDVELEVTYASGSSNGATLATDLGTRTGSVTIPQGSLTATITVPIVDDDEAEEDETFTVTIALDEGAPSNVTVSEAVAQGTILNDDRDVGDVTVSIADAEAMESDTMFFTVFLNRATDSTLIIDVNVPSSPGGRGEAADLLDLDPRRQQTVRINEGDTSAAWSVVLIQDSESEGDETFTVTLSENSANPLPDGVEIEDREATGTILDDDGEGPNPAEITASIADATVAEDGGNASFTVFLNGTVGSDVTLDVAYAGSGSNPATPGDDLGSGRPATVTIAGRATSATLVVPIVDDEIDEEDETFTVTISGPPGGVAIGDGEATGEILDNFDTTAPPVAVSIAPVTVAEGDDAVFTATLSRAVDSAVTLNVAVTAGSSNPATVSGAGADLGTLPPATVTIPRGDTAVDITVPSVDDQDVEEDETFTVTLTATSLPDGVMIPGGAAAATGTITDDDAPPVATIPTASIAPVTVAEDVSGGDAVFTVTLSAAADRAVTLDVSVAAGSTNPATVSGAGADLGTLPPATVTIPQGSLTADITVPIVDDDIAGEGNETFTVTISDADSSLDGVVTISGGGTATGTITDDDTPDVTASIADDVTVPEGGNAVFTAILSEVVEENVTLSVIVRSGTATVGTVDEVGPPDLGTPLPTTVTIAAGETRETFSVPTVADDVEEEDETFTVTLFAFPGALPPGVTIADDGTQTATGTITDSGASEALLAAREAGAGTALRRHAGRFESLTGAVVRNRLDARATRRLSASENVGNGAAAAGGGLGETRWGAWIDGAWAGFDGKASGRQADVYGGVDYLGGGGDWLIGALIGYEAADLDIDDATYRSDYTQFGVYGGARVSERLLFDGAATYGTATPDVTLEGMTSSYDAHRLTVRGALTGDFGLEYGRVLVQPRLGLLYAREQLDAFEGSDDGSATLKLGRLSAGPRLSWAFDGGQVVGGVRAQWDFLQLDDGIGNRISGAADIGVNLDLTPNVILGVQGDIDGIGTSGDFGSLGGRIKLDVRF